MLVDKAASFVKDFFAGLEYEYSILLPDQDEFTHIRNLLQEPGIYERLLKDFDGALPTLVDAFKDRCETEKKIILSLNLAECKAKLNY